MVHQLIRSLEAGGEGAAAEIVAKLGSKAEIARELCYRLYTLCERKKRAAEALSYNGLVQSWPEITRQAREKPQPEGEQGGLFALTHIVSPPEGWIRRNVSLAKGHIAPGLAGYSLSIRERFRINSPFLKENCFP